jgi:Tol biopolymer transport system component
LWSPDEKQLAFIRQNDSGRSDVWILQLDENARPSSEKQITSSGDVRQLLAWNKDDGLLYELEAGQDQSTFWTLAVSVSGASAKRIDVAIKPAAIRGRIPARGSAVYSVEYAGRASDQSTAHIFEIDSEGRARALLHSVPQFDRWPDVTTDGKRLAFSSNRPSPRQ